MNTYNKIFLASLLIFCFLFSCNDAVQKVNKNDKKLSTDLVKNNQSLKNNSKEIIQPIIEILESEYDFGIIKQGEKSSHDY